jgi:hypothetical protein
VTVCGNSSTGCRRGGAGTAPPSLPALRGPAKPGRAASAVSGVLLVGLVALWLAAPPSAASERGPHVVAALREALHLAVERAVASVGRADGFLANPAIRVSVPDQLGKIESALRVAGQDREVERFIVSLNRTAEQAALAARGPLLTSVTEVNLDDGFRVLTGGETAATEALRRHATGRTVNALNPAVVEAMERVGTTRRYKRFVKDAHFGGLIQPVSLDLDAFVVGRIVDGLFYAIGQEERRIRTDPAARPTPRLREVFGAQR